MDPYPHGPQPKWHTKLSLPKGSDDWPSQEVWSFTAAPTLRSVQVSGGASIDPSQTTMPKEWRALPAYLLEPGQALVIEELFRGNPNPPKDELSLERKLWLDFTGEGLSFSDQLSGTLNQAARLDLAKPFELLKVDVSTAGLRWSLRWSPSAQVSRCGSRMYCWKGRGAWRWRGRSLVSAWATDVSHVSWTLQLPPGWSLCMPVAPTAQAVPGSASGACSIFCGADYCYCPRQNCAPLGGRLGLCQPCDYLSAQRCRHFHLAEPGGRAGAVALGVRRLARWLKRYTWLSFASLVLILLSFSVTQVRYALYPQLEGSLDSGEGLVDVLSEGLAMHKMKQESAPVEAAAPLPSCTLNQMRA